MNRINSLQRLEFINSLKRIYTGTLVRQELQATKLITVLFEDRYDLTNSEDVGLILSGMDRVIEEELQPELYSYLTDGIGSLTQMGVTHAANNGLSIMGNTAYDFLGIDTRLAVDYISRVGTDGVRLSDRIWGVSSKEAITNEVFEAVKNGDSMFKLAENISKVVAEGTPKYAIKRIADTELVYAYSHAKADIIIEGAKLFPNAEAFIKVSLSPVHNIYDICDALAGTYKAEDAPIPPFHPNCTCITETFMKVKDTYGRHNYLQTQIDTQKDVTGGHTIETASKTIVIPKKEG